jgi:hypothetical protein
MWHDYFLYFVLPMAIAIALGIVAGISGQRPRRSKMERIAEEHNWFQWVNYLNNDVSWKRGKQGAQRVDPVD